MTQLSETVEFWSSYLKNVDDWRKLVDGVEPKIVGCGAVYELNNPFDRPNESFAIADMRELELAEPHKHINGEVEIYFVLEGVGRIVVGNEVLDLTPGTNIVTASGIVHITRPREGLVLAVVNIPSFKLNNYVVVDSNDAEIIKMIDRL